MMQHIHQRRTTLEGDLGRQNYHAPDFFLNQNQTSLQSQAVSFMGRQHLGHLVFQGQMDWRQYVIGGIYEQSNLHFPLTRRILLQQIARAINYYTGTDPWFTAYDVGTEDKALAEKVERWVRYEADQSDYTTVMNQAIAAAFIQGQAVIKTISEKRTDFYQQYANVAVDDQGKPLRAQDGDYIFKHDEFVPSPQAAMAAAVAQEQGMPPPPAADLVLKRDLATPKPQVLTFQRLLVARALVHFQGAKSRIVPFLDFLCPLTAEDVQTADIVIHMFDEPLIKLLQRFLLLDTGETLSIDDQMERLAEMANAFMGGSVGDDLSAKNQSQPALREADNTTGLDTTEPIGAFMEAYLHYDANGDGIQESLIVICDKDCKRPIFYDYVANVTWNGLRPFQVVRVNDVPNRWHGQSQVETFWNIQEALDLMINRMQQRMNSSGRVDFWNPHMTLEGQDPSNRNLQLNWGGTYTAKDANTDVGKILHSVYLNDITYDKLKDFVELLIQIAINMSGVSNVNDGQMANLDTQKLATGIKNMETSGEELFGTFIATLRPGLKGCLTDFAHTSLISLEQPKMFKFFEGDVGKLATITPDEVRNLRLDVEMSLTKYRSQQDAAQGAAAWQVATQFYVLPIEVQMRLAPLARALLKSYQQRQADELIEPTMLMPPTPPTSTAGPSGANAQPTEQEIPI